MANDKKKKMSREEIIEDIQGKMDSAREAKLAIINARQGAKSSDEGARIKFQEFWAQNRKAYGKEKDLEAILWVHLKAIGCDVPDKFVQGIAHFGLNKI